MATKIILKKSSTGGSVPLTSDLDNGEVAVNLVDRKLYTDNGSTIVRLDSAYVDSSAPSNPVEGDLWYDTGNNLLKAYNGSAFVGVGHLNLSDLDDTTITSIASGEILKWNGSAFVNNTLAEADVQPASTTVATARGAISVGTGLSYDSSTGAISVNSSGGGNISGNDTDDLSEGSTNLYFTDARALAATDGEIVKFANLYATEGALPSASTYHGMFAHVHATGKGYFAHGGSWRKLLDESASTTDVLTEGSTNLYFTNARADARIAAATTDDLTEGSSNLYHTTARARAAVSVTDAGGDGSMAYNSTSGVLTYTGPSAAEVRAHHTGGTGVTITNGSIAIGQAVASSDNVTFNKVTTDLIEGGSTITIDPSATGDATGDVVIAGSLTVQGTTTSVNSNEVNIGDSIIKLNADETGAASQNGGIEIERGTDANVSFIWNESDNKWDLSNETLQNVTLDGGSY